MLGQTSFSRLWLLRSSGSNLASPTYTSYRVGREAQHRSPGNALSKTCLRLPAYVPA